MNFNQTLNVFFSQVKHKLQATLVQISQTKMWTTMRTLHPLPQVLLQLTCLAVMQDMRMLILVSDCYQCKIKGYLKKN